MTAKIRRSRAKLMPRAIAAGQRFAKRAEKLPYFQSATDAYMRGWMAGYRAHRNDVEPPKVSGITNRCYGCDCDGSPERIKHCHELVLKMPDGAHRSKCFYCGWTFGTHRADCPGPLQI